LKNARKRCLMKVKPRERRILWGEALKVFLGFLAAILLLAPPARADEADRMAQMTVMISDAAALLNELVTCRFVGDQGVSPKYLQSIEDSLTAAALQPPQVAELVKMLGQSKPLIGDDQPFAAALLFCDARSPDRVKDYDRFFDLRERIAAAASLPAGRDDAEILAVLGKAVSESNRNSSCIRLDTGRSTRKPGISPEGKIGKHLALFDVSPAVREHLDRIIVPELDIRDFPNFGDLRAFCKMRGDAMKQAFDQKKKIPDPYDAFFALKPAQ
jgi:hypothetical protein